MFIWNIKEAQISWKKHKKQQKFAVESMKKFVVKQLKQPMQQNSLNVAEMLNLAERSWSGSKMWM